MLTWCLVSTIKRQITHNMAFLGGVAVGTTKVDRGVGEHVSLKETTVNDYLQLCRFGNIHSLDGVVNFVYVSY